MNSSAPDLFDPLRLRGGLTLRNRVVMAPMTRSRASEPGDVPHPASSTYYGQRSEAGLIVTEGTVVSREGKGYSLTPGIYDEAQARAWAAVATSVHERSGSRIFQQLWHVGRISHELIAGTQPVAPSARPSPTAKLWFLDPVEGPALLPAGLPRAMTIDDIQRIVQDFVAAARRAVDAGMDGVEIHGANGYLVDQFLRSTTNVRTDSYGGSPAARARFLQELVAAVAGEVGEARVGVRLSPEVDYGDTDDPEICETTLLAAEVLDGLGVAYLHLVESNNSNFLGETQDAPVVDAEFKKHLRSVFGGTIIVATDHDGLSARAALQEGTADAVAFGRPFIANPDLVDRLRHGRPFASSDRDTWYGGDERGYTDYPAYQEQG